jgi:hypothetical protein
MIEFEGVDRLFLTRPMDLDAEDASLDWIVTAIEPRTFCSRKLKPTDVCFSPCA